MLPCSDCCSPSYLVAALSLPASQLGILFHSDYVMAAANRLLPWPLNWNGPFSCFGGFGDHSLPGPLTLHPPVLNTDHRIWPFGYRWGWLSAFLILLAVCPSSVFHFHPLWHSFPTLKIILKLFGSSAVYFGMWMLRSSLPSCGFRLELLPSMAFFCSSVCILRWSRMHIAIYRGVSALKCSAAAPLFLFFPSMLAPPLPYPTETHSLINIFSLFLQTEILSSSSEVLRFPIQGNKRKDYCSVKKSNEIIMKQWRELQMLGIYHLMQIK